MDSKQYGQSGVAGNFEVGKDGPRVVDESGNLAIRNNANNAYAPLRVGDPLTDDDAVSKRYLERQARVVVLTGIDGNSPGTPSDGDVGIVVTAGSTYALKELYRGEGSSWVQISVYEGMTIRITDDLSGTDSYSGDHIYIWDEDTSSWGDIGPAGSVSGVSKTERASLAHDTSSPLNIGSTVPANARSMFCIVNVTQAFNGSAPTLEIGDASDTDRLMAQAEIDLTAVGAYFTVCPYLFGSETQVIATYAADGSTTGTAAIELLYSIA